MAAWTKFPKTPDKRVQPFNTTEWLNEARELPKWAHTLGIIHSGKRLIVRHRNMRNKRERRLSHLQRGSAEMWGRTNIFFEKGKTSIAQPSAISHQPFCSFQHIMTDSFKAVKNNCSSALKLTIIYLPCSQIQGFSSLRNVVASLTWAQPQNSS